jgi:3-hydroxyacyl-[acyl-carrier-protein] dehydratase
MTDSPPPITEELTAPADQCFSFDINAIMRQIPHRYPFLLVDRVLECRRGVGIRALKNVTYNEPFFPGHFPHRPVMPGVMIIEALAQTCGILAFVTAGVVPNENTRFFFVGIDKARFRKPVVPGDQLILTAEVIRSLKGIWKFSTAALVGDAEVASAEMMVAPETGPKAVPGSG